MQKHSNFLLGITAVGMLAAAAQGGDLYTIRTGDDVLRKFDTTTLTFTDIGPIGIAYDFGGMTWDSSTGTMYLIQGRAGPGFYKVDLGTGATSLIGNHGLGDLFSLAHDPTTNTVYGSESSGATGFYKFDVNTGAATFIGDDGNNYDGLTYDPVRNKVVGAYAGQGDLYDIDLSNGVGTLIYNGGFFDNCGFAYDEDTGLYWMITWGGNIWSYDPGNGYARTLVMSGLDPHDGLSAAGPAAPCLDLRVDRLVGGAKADWNVSGATAGEQVAIVYGFAPGSTGVNGFAGYCATFGIQGVNQNKLICRKAADGAGNLTCTKPIPGGASGTRVLSQAAERNTCPDECVSNIDDQVVG